MEEPAAAPTGAREGAGPEGGGASQEDGPGGAQETTGGSAGCESLCPTEEGAGETTLGGEGGAGTSRNGGEEESCSPTHPALSGKGEDHV